MKKLKIEKCIQLQLSSELEFELELEDSDDSELLSEESESTGFFFFPQFLCCINASFSERLRVLRSVVPRTDSSSAWQISVSDFTPKGSRIAAGKEGGSGGCDVDGAAGGREDGGGEGGVAGGRGAGGGGGGGPRGS